MKKYLLSSLLILFTAAPLLASAAPTIKDAFTGGSAAEKVAIKSGYRNADGDDALEYVAFIINTLLSILGVIFVGLMVYGGYLWFTDMGNESRVKKAKNIIEAAIIGIILIMSAYSISYFVIAQMQKKMLNT